MIVYTLMQEEPRDATTPRVSLRHRARRGRRVRPRVQAAAPRRIGRCRRLVTAKGECPDHRRERRAGPKWADQPVVSNWLRWGIDKLPAGRIMESGAF